MSLFANRFILRLLLLTASATIAVNAGASPGCYFPPSTLAEDYRQADRVVVALISGCPGTQQLENGRCPDERYSFDVLEAFKDSVMSGVHSDVVTGTGTMNCGPWFRAGHSYLLFIDKNGDLNQWASGALNGDDSRSATTRERLDILNQYQNGSIGDLSGPWHFFDEGQACYVTHALDGARLSLTYGYVDEGYYMSHRLEKSYGSKGEIVSATGPLVPSEESMHGEMIGPDYGRDTIIISVSLDNSVTAVEGSVSIKVGYRVWPLQRRTIDIRFGNSTPVTIVDEITGGEAANEILEAMSEPTDIVIAAVAIGMGPEVVDESPLRFKTRTTQFPAVAQRFKACVDGTVRQADPRFPKAAGRDQ